MREILFRGKVVSSKWEHQKGYHDKWVYGFYWTNKLGNHFIRVTKDEMGFFVINDYEVKPETLGEYTGLKDKNKKKIYEGDVLTNGIIKFTIEFEEAMFGTIYKGENITVLDSLAQVMRDFDVEVIGNIHEKENEK